MQTKGEKLLLIVEIKWRPETIKKRGEPEKPYE